MGLAVIDLSEVAGFGYDYVTHPRRQCDDEFGLHLSMWDLLIYPVQRRRYQYINIYTPNSLPKRFSIIHHLHQLPPMIPEQLPLESVVFDELDCFLKPLDVFFSLSISLTEVTSPTSHKPIFGCNYQILSKQFRPQIVGARLAEMVGKTFKAFLIVHHVEINQQYYQSHQNNIMKKVILTLLYMLVLVVAEINNFDYSSHGDDWASSNPGSWGDCDPSKEDLVQQSPIEISEGAAKLVPSFLFSNFNPADATLSLLNTTIYLKATSFGEIYTKTVVGDIIVMKATELRFRAHAEHKFQGQDFYDLEMQIFFMEAYPTTETRKLAVSIMFEVAEGASSPILKTIKGGKDQQKLKLNLGEFLSNEQPFDFYYYLGSLTLPPCKDGKLFWIISKKVFKMSQEERDYFWGFFNNKEKKLDGNYRSIQPLRGNNVDYYHFSSK